MFIIFKIRIKIRDGIAGYKERVGRRGSYRNAL